MEGDQRVSLRSNLQGSCCQSYCSPGIYTNARPATFIIYKDRVETENANNPHGEGPIDPDNFAPFPKNPAIAKFFMQLGRVEELGSGVFNVNRFIKEYSGTDSPPFIEGPTFKMIIPINGVVNSVDEPLNIGLADTIIDTVTDTVKNRLASLLTIVAQNPGIRKSALVSRLGISEITIKRDMQTLHEWVSFEGPQRTGGYFVTAKFQKVLKAFDIEIKRINH